MQNIPSLLLPILLLFTSCKKESKPFLGTWSVVNKGHVYTPGPGGGTWTPTEGPPYQLKISRDPDYDDQLTLHNFIGFSNVGAPYSVTALRTSATEFHVSKQFIDAGESWLSDYQVTADGYITSDSIYFHYEYVNDIGDADSGNGSGVKID